MEAAIRNLSKLSKYLTFINDRAKEYSSEDLPIKEWLDNATTDFLLAKRIESLKPQDSQERKLKAIKEILQLPSCISSSDTPDIVLGFEEQFHLKQILRDA